MLMDSVGYGSDGNHLSHQIVREGNMAMDDDMSQLVGETQWLQELQCMAHDGSLQAFLLTIDRSLALKLRCREEEILAELVLVQQKLCALHTSTHPLLSSGQC